MQMSFDPLIPAERAAIQTMLAALSAQGVGMAPTDTPVPVHKHYHPAAGSTLQAVGDMVVISPQAADSMDDTGGIRSVPVPPAPARSIADVSVSTSAPAAPLAGDLAQMFESALPAATASVPAVPPAPAAPVSPALGGDIYSPDAPSSGTHAAMVGAILDKNNLPWDERIHSSSKSLNADGTWRQRRNLPDGLREQVEAELRGQSAGTESTNAAPQQATAPAILSVPAVEATRPSEPATAANVSQQPTNPTGSFQPASAASAVSAPPLPSVPAVPAAPPVPSMPAIPTSTLPVAAPAPAADTGSGQPRVADGDFVALFGKVAKLQADGMLSQHDLERVLKYVGLDSMMLLPTLPEQTQVIDAAIEELFS